MAINSLSLLKPGFKTALVEALYNEILSNSNTYYYFIGKTLEWDGGSDTLSAPQVSGVYEANTREEMIFLKKITPADISYVVPRYDWVAGTVFDMYDDSLGKQITVPCTAGGTYTLSGTFDQTQIGVGYIVSGTNIAVGTAVIAITNTTVTVDTPIQGAVSSATFSNVSYSGATSLDQAKFYCITSDRNVYKCLSNNNNSPSTSKPYATTHETITTDDGYVWKFMYSVPNSLVNKFTTIDDIPVSVSVKNPYYSSGAIRSAIVSEYGSGYVPGDYLVVTGDGYLADNPVRIVTMIVDDAGSGYATPPTITVSAPVDAVDYDTETPYLTNQFVKVGRYIYTVSQGGTSGLSAPTHTSSDPIANGSCSLKFSGYTAEATVSLDGTFVDTAVMEGIIGYLNIDTIGSGYDPLDPPLVSITGDGVGATAVADVSAAGYITKITLTNRGSGYTTATVAIDPPVSGIAAVATAEIYYGYGYSGTPSVSVTAPFTADVVWALGVTADFGDIVQAGTRFYEVTSAGLDQELGPLAPTHTLGTETNGTADLEFVGQTASLSMFVEKTKAKVAPIIETGQITGVIITDPGVGYTTASITAFGTGEGAVITPNLSYGDLNTRQANIELLAVPGTIDHIAILSPGLDYSYATVEIAGDGTGCTAEAVIDQGVITSINVTDPGSGYTQATVAITGNAEATQAYARAIVSPPDGHGKNAIRELFASDLSLSSTVAKDRNQGFEVTNDYRQLGIIKNPQVFGSTLLYNEFSGSACFVVTGDFSYTDINTSSETTLTDSNGKTYKVVAKPATDPGSSVALLVQSLDNATPVIGQVLSYNTTSEATLTAVTNPSINKYSGDILFIDNRSAFMPTDEQTVSIKTAIRL